MGAGERVVHRKLVRDRIPELIRGAGDEPITLVLATDAAYVDALVAKLEEEIDELRSAAASSSSTSWLTSTRCCSR